MNWIKDSWYFLLPLLGLSFYGFALLAAKVRWMLKNPIKEKSQQELFTRIQQGDWKSAYEDLPGHSVEKKLMGRAIIMIQKGRVKEMVDELYGLAKNWLLPFASDLHNFNHIANIATIMGLLGTILGMIMAFNQLLQTGESNPYVLAGGISQALVTTAAGLLIALPMMLSQMLLRRWAQQWEQSLIRIIEILGKYGKDR